MTKRKDEEVFEVEKIVGHAFSKNSKGYIIKYKIKWAGYGEAHNTMEDESNIYSPGLIMDYWNNLPEERDKTLFRRIQSRRKNRIALPPPKPQPKKTTQKKTAQPKKPKIPERLPLVIPAVNDNDNSSEDDDDDDDDEDMKVHPGPVKRKAADYFLEEHARKKQKETIELGNHIIDWDSLAEKVEYIGKESPSETQLHCRVKWKDGVITMHPLSLVKEKRPDLLLERFILMAEEGMN